MSTTNVTEPSLGCCDGGGGGGNDANGTIIFGFLLSVMYFHGLKVAPGNSSTFIFGKMKSKKFYWTLYRTAHVPKYGKQITN